MPNRILHQVNVLGSVATSTLPYLEDPNTGVKMYESSKIIDYLEQQYGK